MTRRNKLILAGLVGMTLGLAPFAAQSQTTNCGARAAVVERLADHFGETRRGIGLGTQDRVVEVFASDETGTWTITVTMPDGRTCLVASGQAWEDRADDLSHLRDDPA
ncbi:MAG: hypothetical protein AAFY65_13415 [Pseudomonadota bacterium]